MSVALVTGSARGIGRGVARAMAGRGDRVHVVWRSSEEQRAELEAEFAGRVHRADLVRPQDCERLVAEVLETDGALDLVVHAVGEYVFAPLSQTSPVDFVRMLENNVGSAFHLASAARGAVREARGAFVFFGCSGVASLRARRDAPAYVAAKTALLAFVRSFALEEAPHGVRANMVSPGVVPHADASDDTLDPAVQARVPMGRTATVEDLANAVLWLGSDRAGHVTGQNLDVAGGWQL